MNFNLRKELITILIFLSAEKDIEPKRYNHYVDEILGSIKKRIDSLKGTLNPEYDQMMISTLNWVKEMLK